MEETTLSPINKAVINDVMQNVHDDLVKSGIKNEKIKQNCYLPRNKTG
jgi:hypothetical protein